MYNITLNSPWFEYVKSGRKKYEGRCNWKQYKNFQIGDTLQISHHVHKDIPPYVVTITSIKKYRNFEEALSSLGLEYTLPEVYTIQEGVEIYKKFYKQETQEIYGVLMIELLLK